MLSRNTVSLDATLEAANGWPDSPKRRALARPIRRIHGSRYWGKFYFCRVLPTRRRTARKTLSVAPSYEAIMGYPNSPEVRPSSGESMQRLTPTWLSFAGAGSGQPATAIERDERLAIAAQGDRAANRFLPKHERVAAGNVQPVPTIPPRPQRLARLAQPCRESMMHEPRRARNVR
jgi:hypothetical protein